ncbi:MAG: hypothetical protein OEY99_03685, partial [Aigarchaeota archaeon]|nr:hypothetical protein [Aigarchaeota archaeon]
MKSVAYKRHLERRRFVQKFGLRSEQVRETLADTPPYVELEATVPAETLVTGLRGRFILVLRNTMPKNVLSTARHSEL